MYKNTYLQNVLAIYGSIATNVWEKNTLKVACIKTNSYLYLWSIFLKPLHADSSISVPLCIEKSTKERNKINNL